MPADQRSDSREREVDGPRGTAAHDTSDRAVWRRRLCSLLVAGAVAAFALAALRAGSDSSGEARGTSDESEADGEESSDRGAQSTDSSASPPDVDEPRPEVDLSAVPRNDPLEIARWWAASYARYSGAEPPEVLADRLAPATAPELRDEMAARPAAASYDPPVEIVGASATAVEGADASADAGRRARVAVETEGALLVYDLVLTQGPAGEWRVSELAQV